ncbi:UNVERIFIED_CONTAM: hypothetical protein FKN15_042971 [Acipenser sinensis]
MNTRCPPKRVPSADRIFSHCKPTMQPPQSYSIGGQHNSRQLTGKPTGARPDYDAGAFPIKNWEAAWSSEVIFATARGNCTAMQHKGGERPLYGENYCTKPFHSKLVLVNALSSRGRVKWLFVGRSRRENSRTPGAKK